MAADTPALDAWLARPAVRTHHARSAAADPATLWSAAAALRLEDTAALGTLVRWRIPGLAPGLTYFEMLRSYPFCVLGEDEHTLLSGLCGRIWTLARDYPRLAGPEDFTAWREPGTVQVLFAHWVRPLPGGGAELVSEARVRPTDRGGAARLRALWALLGPFERLVAGEPLALAARAAEAGAA